MRFLIALLLLPCFAWAAPAGQDYTGHADAYFCPRDGKFYISISLYQNACAGDDVALLTDGSVKYIDSVSGLDTNAGTFAAPWQTLSKCEGLASGVDCRMKNGSVFTDQDMDITHSGTSVDPVIIGCYDDVGGVPKETPACQYTVDGILTSTCLAANTCDMNDITLGGFYTGLITISANYVTIRDAIIQYHVGRGISAKGTGAGEGDNITIERVLVRWVGVQAGVFESDITNLVLRDNVAHDIGWCEAGNYVVPLTNCGSGGWSGGWVITRSVECNCLFQGNFIYRHYGEGYNIGLATRVVWRGNKASNGRGASYYIDIGNNILLENNIAVGNAATGNQFPNGHTGGGGAGLAIAMEMGRAKNPDAPIAVGTNNLVRNHVSIGNSRCLTTGVESGVYTTYGLIMGFQVYGMTCLASVNAPVDLKVGSGQANGMGAITIANSIFYSPSAVADAAALPCRQQAFGPVTMENNLWDRDPSVTCPSATIAAKNIVGDPLLPTSDAQARVTDYTNIPVISLLRPQSGSPAIGAGKNFARTEVSWLATNLWTIEDKMTGFAGSDCGSQWFTQAHPVDFNCRPWRGHIGAVRPD